MGAATRMTIHGNYYRGLSSVFKNSSGGRRAMYRLAGEVIRTEIRDFAKKHSTLQEKCSMESIEALSWENVFSEVKQRAPMLYNAILYAVSSKKSEGEMEW